MSMCEPAGLANGLSPGKCSEDDLCRYHQGVEDSSLAAIDALAAALDIDVYVCEGMNVGARLVNDANGEILDAQLGSLVRHIALALTNGDTVRVVPRLVSARDSLPGRTSA